MAGENGRCNKCGICLSVCPVYKETAQEQLSPRAKVRLIHSYEENSLSSSSATLNELVNRCLMCGSCHANCPSGVDHPEMYINMRDEISRNQPTPLIIRSLVFLLAKEKRLARAAGLAYRARKIMPQKLIKHLSVAGLNIDQLPPMGPQPFREQVETEIPPIGQERGRLLYFTGCGTNHLFADTGRATISLLTSLGYRVIIPPQQTCCSLPMLYHGGGEQARQNIEQNLKALDDAECEAIIVDCPTCGIGLAKEYPSALRRWGLPSARADRIAARVCNLLPFLSSRLEQLPLAPPDSPITITYHAPCHLKNEVPAADSLFGRLPGVTYRPATDSHQCCGGGGTFWYEYPDTATAMADKKIRMAQATGAELWLTDCPVCRLNLSGRLTNVSRLRLDHPATFLVNLLLKKDPRLRYG